MAVTPTTMTELNDLAKDFYSDVYVQLMNTETPLKNQLARLEGASFTGRKWIFGTKTAVGGGASNAGANKSLPAATDGTYDQGEATVVRTYTRMALDGLAIEVTKKQQGSYRPAVAEVMADRLSAIDLEVNRQMFSKGNGQLCNISGAGAASATQSVANDYGVANGGPGAKHIYVGDQLALYDNTNALIGRRTVTAVDQSASPNTVTLDSTITSTAATNYFAKSTADSDNFSAGEAGGLLQSVATTAAFEQITHNRWRAVVDANAGTLRDISDSLVMKMLATIREKSRKVPNLVVTSPGIQLKYSEIFLPIRRIDGQDAQLKGGYKPISQIVHGGGTIPVIADSDAAESRMWFLNTDAFRMADLVGTEFADLDGGQFIRVTDKDAIEGYVRKYWQLITVQRNANGVIEDLNTIDTINRTAA
jgi:hypothetical protein